MFNSKDVIVLQGTWANDRFKNWIQNDDLYYKLTIENHFIFWLAYKIRLTL